MPKARTTITLDERVLHAVRVSGRSHSDVIEGKARVAADVRDQERANHRHRLGRAGALRIYPLVAAGFRSLVAAAFDRFGLNRQTRFSIARVRPGMHAAMRLRLTTRERPEPLRRTAAASLGLV